MGTKPLIEIGTGKAWAMLRMWGPLRGGPREGTGSEECASPSARSRDLPT